VNRNNLTRYSTLVFICIAIIVMVQTFVFSGPQPELVVQAVEGNPGVLTEYGLIKEIHILALPGSEKRWEGTGFSLNGTWYGTYFLRTLGEKKTGVLKIDWRDDSNQGVRLLKISEVNEVGSDRVIWPK
jgi:hypothetical protein